MAPRTPRIPKTPRSGDKSSGSSRDETYGEVLKKYLKGAITPATPRRKSSGAKGELHPLGRRGDKPAHHGGPQLFATAFEDGLRASLKEQRDGHRVAFTPRMPTTPKTPRTPGGTHMSAHPVRKATYSNKKSLQSVSRGERLSIPEKSWTSHLREEKTPFTPGTSPRMMKMRSTLLYERPPVDLQPNNPTTAKLPKPPKRRGEGRSQTAPEQRVQEQFPHLPPPDPQLEGGFRVTKQKISEEERRKNYRLYTPSGHKKSLIARSRNIYGASQEWYAVTQTALIGLDTDIKDISPPLLRGLLALYPKDHDPLKVLEAHIEEDEPPRKWPQKKYNLARKYVKTANIADMVVNPKRRQLLKTAQEKRVGHSFGLVQQLSETLPDPTSDKEHSETLRQLFHTTAEDEMTPGTGGEKREMEPWVLSREELQNIQSMGMVPPKSRMKLKELPNSDGCLPNGEPWPAVCGADRYFDEVYVKPNMGQCWDRRLWTHVEMERSKFKPSSPDKSVNQVDKKNQLDIFNVSEKLLKKAGVIAFQKYSPLAKDDLSVPLFEVLVQVELMNLLKDGKQLSDTPDLEEIEMAQTIKEYTKRGKEIATFERSRRNYVFHDPEGKTEFRSILELAEEIVEEIQTAKPTHVSTHQVGLTEDDSQLLYSIASEKIGKKQRRDSKSFWDMKVPHVVTTIWPKVGDMLGGTRIEVTGKGFLGDPNVKVIFAWTTNDGRTFEREAEDLEVLGDRKIIANTPKGFAVTAHMVYVEISGVRSKPKRQMEFRYSGPVITNLSPPEGPSRGATMITISGTSLGTDPRKCTVFVGRKACSRLQVVTPGKIITAMTPPGMPASKHMISMVVITDGGEKVTTEMNTSFMFEYISNDLAPTTMKQFKKIDYLGGVLIDIADCFKKSPTPESDMKTIVTYLSEMLPFIHNVFLWYCMEVHVQPGEETNSLSRRQWRTFLEESRILGKNQEGHKIPVSMSDVVFIRANKEYEETEEKPDTLDLMQPQKMLLEENDDNALILPEFLGGIIRIATAKYEGQDPPLTITERFLNLVGNHIKPYAHHIPSHMNFFIQVTERDVQELIEDHRHSLEELFDKYCKGNEDHEFDRMLIDEGEMAQMLHDASLSEYVTHGEIRRAFLFSALGRWVTEFGEDHQCDGMCSCSLESDTVVIFSKDPDKKMEYFEKRRQQFSDAGAIAEEHAAAQDRRQLSFDAWIECLCRLAYLHECIDFDRPQHMMTKSLKQMILPLLQQLVTAIQ